MTNTHCHCGNQLTNNKCKPEPGANYADWCKQHTNHEIGYQWD